jgi:hypothetical protein
MRRRFDHGHENDHENDHENENENEDENEDEDEDEERARRRASALLQETPDAAMFPHGIGGQPFPCRLESFR